jgi:hypothetical protein
MCLYVQKNWQALRATKAAVAAADAIEVGFH